MAATGGLLTNPEGEVNQQAGEAQASSTNLQSSNDESASKEQSSSTVASTPATESDRETKPPEDEDTIRTLHGLKVRTVVSS